MIEIIFRWMSFIYYFTHTLEPNQTLCKGMSPVVDSERVNSELKLLYMERRFNK